MLALRRSLVQSARIARPRNHGQRPTSAVHVMALIRATIGVRGIRRAWRYGGVGSFSHTNPYMYASEFAPRLYKQQKSPVLIQLIRGFRDPMYH
jgi:hypothetical protein